MLVPVSETPSIVISKMHAKIFDTAALPGELFTYVDGEDPRPALRAAFAGFERERIAAEDSLWFGDVDLLTSTLPELRLVREPGLFARLRAVKDAAEIDALRRASEAHDVGYATALEVCRPGASVPAAGAAIVAAMLAAGSEELAIAGTFHDLSARDFQAGQIVDVDLWPGSHRGYRADSARNVFLGEPSAEARRLYAATHAAYDAAMAAVRPGVALEDVHRACASVMADAGYEQVWKVGHGVGLADAHEPPLLQLGNADPVEAGMVFTIDPGAFIARDTPIHIEDTVLVTATGAESLTRFPRALDALIVR